jgi:hypothetical protein
MKAKLNTVIFSALLLAALPVKAQFADNRDFRYDDAGTVNAPMPESNEKKC